jgi:hypothetical protein
MRRYRLRLRADGSSATRHIDSLLMSISECLACDRSFLKTACRARRTNPNRPLVAAVFTPLYLPKSLAADEFASDWVWSGMLDPTPIDELPVSASQVCGSSDAVRPNTTAGVPNRSSRSAHIAIIGAEVFQLH